MYVKLSIHPAQIRVGVSSELERPRIEEGGMSHCFFKIAWNPQDSSPTNKTNHLDWKGNVRLSDSQVEKISNSLPIAS